MAQIVVLSALVGAVAALAGGRQGTRPREETLAALQRHTEAFWFAGALVAGAISLLFRLYDGRWALGLLLAAAGAAILPSLRSPEEGRSVGPSAAWLLSGWTVAAGAVAGCVGVIVGVVLLLGFGGGRVDFGHCRRRYLPMLAASLAIGILILEGVLSQFGAANDRFQAGYLLPMLSDERRASAGAADPRLTLPRARKERR